MVRDPALASLALELGLIPHVQVRQMQHLIPSRLRQELADRIGCTIQQALKASDLAKLDQLRCCTDHPAVFDTEVRLEPRGQKHTASEKLEPRSVQVLASESHRDAADQISSSWNQSRDGRHDTLQAADLQVRLVSACPAVGFSLALSGPVQQLLAAPCEHRAAAVRSSSCRPSQDQLLVSSTSGSSHSERPWQVKLLVVSSSSISSSSCCGSSAGLRLARHLVFVCFALACWEQGGRQVELLHGPWHRPAMQGGARSLRGNGYGRILYYMYGI